MTSPSTASTRSRCRRRPAPGSCSAATADVVAEQGWLRPDFADRDGILRIDSHSFALVVDGLRVLVDTGVGNGKTRANPAWHDLRTDYLARLAAAGFAPESVDLVVLTHLHTDHVGWNTREAEGAWVPTFPNARYLTAKAEYDFWAAYDMEEARRAMFRDSVHPVEEAGLLDLVDVPSEGIDIAAGLRLVAGPGAHSWPRRRPGEQCRCHGGDHRGLHPSPRTAGASGNRQLCRHRPRAGRGDPPFAARLARRHRRPAPRHSLPSADHAAVSSPWATPTGSSPCPAGARWPEPDHAAHRAAAADAGPRGGVDRLGGILRRSEPAGGGLS